MKAEIVPATLAHAEAIAANPRPADVAEVWASHRATVMDAMRRGMRYGARTGLVDGEPVCMFGTVPDCALLVPWMVSSAAMDTLRVQKSLLRLSKSVVAGMRAHGATLFNAVDDRNEAAKRWLAWLGFELDDAVPAGWDGVMFRFFHWSPR